MAEKSKVNRIEIISLKAGIIAVFIAVILGVSFGLGFTYWNKVDGRGFAVLACYLSIGGLYSLFYLVKVIKKWKKHQKISLKWESLFVSDRIFLCLVLGFIASSFACAMAYLQNQMVRDMLSEDHSLQGISNCLYLVREGIYWERFVLIFILFGFVISHIIVPCRKMYTKLFQYRWVAGALLLLFLVLGRYTGDSIGCFDLFVQPGEGSEYRTAVLGKERLIRSDEWVVGTPIRLASSKGESPYSTYSEILRGTKTLSGIYGISMDYVTLATNPFLLTWKALGVEYGYSFAWFAPILLTFLVSIEFMMILTKRKKLLSTLGAVLIVCSSFYLWWGFPSFLLSAQGSLVCLYYFLHCKKKWLKLVWSVAMGWCVSAFILIMYPAWQVPVGYLVLLILIWMFKENWEKIKHLKLFDWGMLALALAIVGSFVFAYFKTDKEYLDAIMNTVYPGKRLSTGGYYILKDFQYFESLLFPFKEHTNPSEAATFFSFFPIPLILGVYRLIRAKKKDLLSIGLVLFSVIMLAYSTIGFPSLIAKITLMNYTTVFRAIDILGLAMVYLMIRSLSEMEDEQLKMLPRVISVIIGGGCAAFAWYQCEKAAPGYISVCFGIFVCVLIIYASVVLLSKHRKQMVHIFCIVMISISVLSAICIRPLMKGTDAIYSKPAAKAVMELVEKEPNAKWIAYENNPIVYSSFLIACGASTINSLNFYPNMDLWNKLDPNGKFENVYNRYCHIVMHFQNEEETNMGLIQDDLVEVNLNEKDITKTGAKYIFSHSVMPEISSVQLKKIYEEAGITIYEIQA